MQPTDPDPLSTAAPGTSGPGRPRSDRSRTAILGAAVALFEEQGWSRLSIEAIARRAGVGKATIYRWWPTKAAILMDALTEASAPRAAFPDTDDALDDLRVQLRSIVELFTATTTGRGLLTLIAESQHDPDLATALRDRLIGRRRQAAVGVVRRGQRDGRIRKDVDPDLAVDAIYGAVYYRLLVSHERTVPEDADRVLALLAPALAVPA